MQIVILCFLSEDWTPKAFIKPHVTVALSISSPDWLCPGLQLHQVFLGFLLTPGHFYFHYLTTFYSKFYLVYSCFGFYYHVSKLKCFFGSIRGCAVKLQCTGKYMHQNRIDTFC